MSLLIKFQLAKLQNNQRSCLLALRARLTREPATCVLVLQIKLRQTERRDRRKRKKFGQDIDPWEDRPDIVKTEHGSVPQLVVQEHMGWEVDSWTDFGSLQSEMWKQCIIQCWNLEQTMKQWNCFNFNFFKSWNVMKNRSQSFWEMKNEIVTRLNRVKSYWKPKSTAMQILVLYSVNKPTNRPNVNRETDSSRVLEPTYL